ncbi:hypothetical protein [Chroococcus sp. FPU101]|uniref:hypothetical protein n=1 Tax=Chroococcus sp. FPU101 TaxID=1974212 RepID=UPI001A8D6114|nr:hypothetical protein [Chroococcus sp. FPU101]GFE70789.1 hypothetical protein CFPU101_33990 [Chroococcus sp. FPU101]
MKVKWKKLVTMSLMWLASEIVLNFSGLDNLADYGEFILSHHASTVINIAKIH